MTGLVADLAVRRGGFRAAAELACPPGEVLAVVGPSGAGKSSLLRALAGLEPGAEGRVEVAGRTWQDSAGGVFLPPHRRAAGVVFQDARLFPHLSVRGNLEYGWRRVGRARGRLVPDSVIDWLGLASLLARRVDDLSGGERQRVALGRALLAGPDLLLLDEPLASLDGAAKAAILPWLEGVIRGLDLPVVYVSHSRGEVLRLADRVAVLVGGRVEASGPVAGMALHLEAVPPEPGDDLGAVLEARVVGHEEADDLTRLGFLGGELVVPGRAGAVGDRRRVRVLARDVSLCLEPPRASSILNVLPGRVGEVREADDQVLVEVTVGETAFLARITRRSRRELGIRAGQDVYCQVKAVALD